MITRSRRHETLDFAGRLYSHAVVTDTRYGRMIMRDEPCFISLSAADDYAAIHGGTVVKIDDSVIVSVTGDEADALYRARMV